jgi:hypothetical protein
MRKSVRRPGSSQAGSIDGHCEAGTGEARVRVRREAAFLAVGRRPGVALPVGELRRRSSVMPSHHTSPSGVSATFVKITLRSSIFIAFGLVCSEVPGATPNRPYSGLMARNGRPGRA